MANKRKRQESTASPEKQVASPLAPTKAGKSSKKRRRNDEDVAVIWELADGSRQTQRNYSKDATFEKTVTKVIKKLKIDRPWDVKFTQVREGGHEVEIIDKYDYEAMKERAVAGGSSTTLMMRVYPGGFRADSLIPSTFSSPSTSFIPSRASIIISPTPTPTTSPSQPSRKGKERAIEPAQTPSTPTIADSPGSTPRSILSPRGNADGSSAKGKGKSKRVSIASPPESPSMHPKKEKRKKEKSAPIPMNLPPAVQTDAAASGSKLAPPPLAQPWNKYKPAISSPLAQREDPMQQAGQAAVEVTPRKRAKKPKKQANKEAVAQPTPSSGAAAPAQTAVAGEGDSIPATPKTRKPRKSKSLSEAPQATSTASDAVQQSARPSRADVKRKPRKSKGSSEATEAVISAEQTSPAGVPTEELVSAPTSTPIQPKKYISLASPWLYHQRPAEPHHLPDHSSSSFSPPRKPTSRSADMSMPASAATETVRAEAQSSQDDLAVDASVAEQGASAPASVDTTEVPVEAEVLVEAAGVAKPASSAGGEGVGSSKKPRKGKKKAEAAQPLPTGETAELGASVVASGDEPVLSNYEMALRKLRASRRQNEDAATPASTRETPSTETPSNEMPQGTITETTEDTAVTGPSVAAAETTPNVAEPETITPLAKGKKPRPVKARLSAEAPPKSLAMSIMAQYRAKKAAEEEAQEGVSPTLEAAEVVQDETTSAPVAPAEQPVADVSSASVDDPMTSSPVDEATTSGETDGPIPAADAIAVTEVAEEPQIVAQEPPSENTGAATVDGEEDQPTANGINGTDASEAVVPEVATNDEAASESPARPIDTRPSSSTKSTRTAKLTPQKGWWSDDLGPDVSRSGGKAQSAMLAGRASCIICATSPTHLQKDCPEVKKGLPTLQALLEDRRKQLHEAEEALAERKAGRTGRSRSALDEATDWAKESVQTIERWVTRLQGYEEVRRKVSGAALNRSTAEAATEPIANWAAASMSVPPAESKKTDKLADDPPAPVPASITKPSQEVPSTPMNKLPEQPFAVLSTLDALHQKALARGARPRKAGSLSGLSASDALIETGSSDSESDSEPPSPIPRSRSASISSDEGSSSGSDTGSDSEYDSDHSRGSSQKDNAELQPPLSEQPEEEDGDNEASDRSSSSSGSDSASSSSSRSASPSSSSSISDNDDPEAAFRKILAKPLSAAEKRKARLSAASMATSQVVDDISIDGESDAEDIDDDEEEQEDARRRSQYSARRGSDSSIDVGVEEDDERMDVDMDARSDIQPSSLTQPPPIVPADDTETIVEDSQPEVASASTSPTKRSNTSFVAMDEEAGASPTVNDFEGARALQDAIIEERGPNVLVEETMEEQKRPGHVISQGLPSPPSSVENDLVATQVRGADSTPRARRGRPSQVSIPSSQPTQPSQLSQPQSSQPLRRSARNSASVTTSPVRSTSQLIDGLEEPSQPTQEPEVPDVRRRLRSASREVPDLMPSPRITRRTSSRASQEPVSQPLLTGLSNGTTPRTRRTASVTASPEQPKSRRASGTLTRSQSQAKMHGIDTIEEDAEVNENNENEGLQLSLTDDQAPKVSCEVFFGTKANMKAIRQAGSALPSSQVDELESSQAIPHENGDRTPFKPTALVEESPLFMTQGSQPLATQKYTLVDSSLSNGTNGVRHTSPIIEEEEDGQRTDDESIQSNQSNQSSSDDDEPDSPIIRPITAPRRTTSQGPPALVSIPSLSSLDTALLRSGGRSMTNGRNGVSASQPVGRSKSMMAASDSESESDVSSSSEDEVPAGKKGRFATGRTKTKAKPKTRGRMSGW